MPFPFKKMHGLGNDFIMMKASDLPTLDLSALQTLAKRVCNRHFGIEADGLIVATPAMKRACFDFQKLPPTMGVA
jgi:diaminopimelate epimerase